jgi:ankyrin repeat protein
MMVFVQADDRNYVNQSTPLHVAASNGRLAAVQTLLQAKAELNARDKVLPTLITCCL